VKLDADKPLELYDLAADPAETKDIAQANPDVVKRLEAHMKAAADPWSQPQERSPFLKKK
jgi:DNA anti-recombination protein RmuC